jgi:hypothetical protein
MACIQLILDPCQPPPQSARGSPATAQAERYARPVSPKKRSTSGLSGNPQRRAQQLRDRQVRRPNEAEIESRARNLSAEDRQAFADLARRLAGDAPAEPWWAGSHERVISAALASPVPDRVVDIETLVSIAVGDEFFDRLESEDRGQAPTQWLRALIEEVGARLGAAISRSAPDWPQLWALLCGLRLISPVTAPDKHFPDIKFPRETARSVLISAANLLAGAGLTPAVTIPHDDEDWVPGRALVARDAYGSRFLLAMPFGLDNTPGDTQQTPGHWYAWDIDACWITTVVSAGAFGSAEAALADWRAAVGATASEAGLGPCPRDLACWLLGPALHTGPLGEMFQGDEPRELIREHYRLRRRAQIAVGPLPDDGELTEPVIAPEMDTGPFIDWYSQRHSDAPKPGKFRKVAAGTVEMLLSEWGPHEHPDERSVYACSPHRIEMLGRIVRGNLYPDEGNAVLRMLPDWVQWCIDQAGLAGDAATCALKASSAEAANLRTGDYIPDNDDGAPFRRPELLGVPWVTL